MDIGDLRGLGTLIVALAFIGMSLWVSSSKRNPDFAEARMAPFADEPQVRGPAPEDVGSGDLTASAAPASSRLKPLPQTPCQSGRSGFSREVVMAGDINASAAEAEQPVVRSTQP
ncbi:MAG: cytochrome c oxidase, cbb3-type, CcoQ subunit [Pseudomonas sp.]|nr:cytochrome c oxidase, cbb3-type, CcoQ subunit [Pseudomonas sp.]